MSFATILIKPAKHPGRLDKMKHGDVIVYLHGVYKRWVEFNSKEAE
jgi:hypothetical protein